MPNVIAFNPAVMFASSDINQASSTTSYYPLGSNVFAQAVSTEANIQSTVRTTGALYNLFVNILTNGISGATTIRLRRSASPGSQVLSIPSGATGQFVDLIHRDTVTSGATIDYQIVTTGGTTITGTELSLIFAATAQTNTPTRPTLAGLFGVSGNANTTTFFSIAGYANSSLGSVTEQPTQYIFRLGAKATNFCLNIQTNSRTDTVTVGTRLNGVNGNLVISVPTVTTGTLEDTTHQDVINPGDAWDYYFTTGADNTNTILCQLLAFDMNNDNLTSFMMTSVAAPISFVGGFSGWIYAQGELRSNASNPGNSAIYAQVGYRASRLMVNVVTNAATTPTILYFMINQLRAGMNVYVAPGATGIFEDVIDVDTVQPSDTIEYELDSGNGGNVSIGVVGHTVQYTGPSFRLPGVRPRVAAPGLAR